MYEVDVFLGKCYQIGGTESVMTITFAMPFLDLKKVVGIKCAIETEKGMTKNIWHLKVQ